jgi:hypothetical protein
MYVPPRDRHRYRTCSATSCDELVLPPRRKCNRCRKGKTSTVTVLRPSRKGMNARGTCLHKADKVRTKRAKRQNPGGLTPVLRTTNWEMT